MSIDGGSTGRMPHSMPVFWPMRLRVLETTNVYGPHSLLSLAALGREWGECEWTARDLWEKS